MTAAQQDALQRIKHEIREHFEGGVAIVTTANDDLTESQTELIWHGGFPLAVGLCEVGKERLIESNRLKNPPTDHDDT